MDDEERTRRGRESRSRFRGVRQELSEEVDLPEGYGVELASALGEESGASERVLLLRRSNDTVAWVFAYDATRPTSEEVSQRAWDDHRAMESEQ